MGVNGLWRLLDATGKQVPLETLEGKVLAIDISIWIHQVLQGYQDRFGNPKPNAHLIGLFYRICKLLYCKIKPVFVFDGGVPILKKNTTALRRKQKSMAKDKAQQMRTELINNLMKHSTVKTVLNTDKQNTTNRCPKIVINMQNKGIVDDLFILPEMPSTSTAELSVTDDDESNSADEPSPRKQTKWVGNIHNVNVSSAEFNALPADMRYEILTDLKETRKQSSWGRLYEMPEESNAFSSFQLQRLLKRRLVQESLESAEKEMGGKTLTLDELDKLLKEQGIPTNVPNYTYRIAADDTTRFVYISDKNAYLKGREISSNIDYTGNEQDRIDEPVAGPSKPIPICDDMNEYDLEMDDWDSDVEVTAVDNFKFAEVSSDTESEVDLKELRSRKYTGKNPALTYMLEYSGLTEKQICTLLEQKNKKDPRGTESISKIPPQSDSLETQGRENKTNFSSSEQSTLLPEDDTDNRSAHTPRAEFCHSNFEVNVSASPARVTNLLDELQADSQGATAISSGSDSGSDDFIEIEEAPLANRSVNIDVNNTVPRRSIEITFKSDEKPEEDIFADVFETPKSELNNLLVTTNSNVPCTKSAKKFLQPNDAQPTVEVNLEDTSIVAELTKTETKDKSNIEDVTSTEKGANNAEAGGITDTTNECVSIVPTKEIELLPTNEDELVSLQAQLEDRQSELMANIGKLERQGIDISDQIRAEAQELLRLFGIPYVVAPMEAEAQCAYLEQIQFTDGTITDDSDIWLFGGRCVYKNFFDNDKKVLEFRSGDIEYHFKLTRNEMIKLALLVGSDYTIGLSGIGPVTALEILAAFPSEGDNLLQGLSNFCSWIESGRSVAPGRTTLRNKLRNLQIHKGFPSQAVVQAYLFPKVDESKETFTWGKPSMLLLSDYAKRKFGWDASKFEKIMAPVSKRLEEKQSQSKLSAYFTAQTIPKSIETNLSKRVQKAVQRLNNEIMEEDRSAKKKEKEKKKKCSEKGKKNEWKNEEALIDCAKPKIVSVSACNEKNIEEYIPQREKDKANALKKKLRAIEVLRKSKQGLYKTKKVRRCVRKVKEKAELSESDSS